MFVSLRLDVAIAFLYSSQFSSLNWSAALLVVVSIFIELTVVSRTDGGTGKRVPLLLVTNGLTYNLKIK